MSIKCSVGKHIFFFGNDPKQFPFFQLSGLMTSQPSFNHTQYPHKVIRKSPGRNPLGLMFIYAIGVVLYLKEKVDNFSSRIGKAPSIIQDVSWYFCVSLPLLRNVRNFQWNPLGKIFLQIKSLLYNAGKLPGICEHYIQAKYWQLYDTPTE